MDSFRSNQELIEDITKDLENSSLETENGNTTVSSEDNEKSTQSVRKEYHEDIELIDEASLLDRDSILSDKEKEVKYIYLSYFYHGKYVYCTYFNYHKS